MTASKRNGTSWKSGQSGNPKGRPKGAGKIAQLRETIAEAVPDILAALIAQAKAGDVAAARVLVERAIPAIKPVELPAAIALPTDATLTAQGQAIMGATAAGTLAPGQGAALLTALATVAKLVETDELLRRVAALESARDTNAN